RRAEELEGLVYEVGAQVEQGPAALGRIGLLAPAGLGLGAPALEARLEAQDLAEVACVEQSAHGEEVAVEAAVVEDGQGHLGGIGRLHDAVGLGGGGGE